MNSRANTILDFWFVKTSSDKRFKKDDILDCSLELKTLDILFKKIENDN